MLIDTDRPWKDLEAFLRVYNYFHADLLTSDIRLPQRVREFALLMRELFPEKQFALDVERKVWLV